MPIGRTEISTFRVNFIWTIKSNLPLIWRSEMLINNIVSFNTRGIQLPEPFGGPPSILYQSRLMTKELWFLRKSIYTDTQEKIQSTIPCKRNLRSQIMQLYHLQMFTVSPLNNILRSNFFILNCFQKQLNMLFITLTRQ